MPEQRTNLHTVFGAYQLPRGPKSKILTKMADGSWIPVDPAIVPRIPGLPYWCTDTKQLYCYSEVTGTWELMTNDGSIGMFDQETIRGSGTKEDPYRVAEVIQEYDKGKGVWPLKNGYTLGACVHSPSIINGDSLGGVEGIYKLLRQNTRVWRVILPEHLPIGVARAFNPGDFFYIVGLDNMYNGVYFVNNAIISLLISPNDQKDLKALIAKGHIFPMTKGIPGTTEQVKPFVPNKEYHENDFVYVPVDQFYYDENGDRVPGAGYSKVFIALYSYPEFLPQEELNEFDDSTGWHLLADVNSTGVNTALIGTCLGFMWNWVDGVCGTKVPDGYEACDGSEVSKSRYTALYNVLCRLSPDGTCPYGETETMFTLPRADNQIIFTGVYNG